MRAATIAGAGTAAHCLPALAPLSQRLSRGLRIPTRLACAGGVGATFDDGPHPRGTPAVLDELARGGARATFFLVGEQVERAPAAAAEIVAAGHEVGLHGQRHRNMLRLTPRQLADDLDRGQAAIAEATGVRPALYRPPYGIFSLAGLRVVRARGLAPVLWSRWGRDWSARATPSGIASRVTRELSGGELLLLHDSDAYSAPDSWKRTAAAIPLALDELGRRGLATVAVVPGLLRTA